MLKDILNKLNGELGQTVAVVICCFLLLWTFSCESRVRSLTDADQKITRSELDSELDFLISQAEIRYAELNKQDAIKKTVYDSAMLWAQSGSINPLGIITSLAAILGIGAAVDNVRKRKVIRTNLVEYVEATQKNGPPPVATSDV